MLSNFVSGLIIRAAISDVDRYGRSIAVIICEGSNIKTDMGKRGGARACLRYVNDRRCTQWQAESRQAKRGPWNLQADRIMAPSDWRAARRDGKR